MASDLTTEQLQNILQGISIPPQPQIMVDLQMEQVMPDPDIGRIAKLISQDVGLSGAILKLVNSPVLGLKNKITSIEQAVSLIGLNAVVNMVNGLSIKSEMADEKIVSLTRFWDTATDIAMVSANVARQIGYSNPDEAYALGLFHNCGIPLMMMRFDDYNDIMEEAYSGKYERVIDAENKKYNTNHAVVGYYTAKSWNLPKQICEVIAEHHSAGRILLEQPVKNREKATLLATLKIAEHICGNFKILGNQDNDFEWEHSEHAILEYVGLTSYDIEEMSESFMELGISVHNYLR